MLYNKEVRNPRGTLLLITGCRNRCRSASQNFFVRQKSLSTSEFINLIRVHCFHYYHVHYISLVIVFYYHHSILINLYIIHQEVAFGRPEYQFLSVKHEPEPASLWNQPLDQRRRTLPLTSYSGYNTPGGRSGVSF